MFCLTFLLGHIVLVRELMARPSKHFHFLINLRYSLDLLHYVFKLYY